MTFDGQTVGVLGLGLIGGSIARDLAARGARVIARDADAATLDAACDAGIVHRRLGPSLEGLEMAATVIVAVPVSQTPHVLQAIATHLNSAALVMDVGSTKRSAVGAAMSLGVAAQFVGAHPMTGDHRAGWSASRSGLFTNATVYLCPTALTLGNRLEQARAFWASLGATTELIEAGAHDTRVALASHLPHVMSAALALTLSKAEVGLESVGPGGRDVLRIAGSSPDTWTAIALDNTDCILNALAALRRELDQFEGALRGHDAPRLRALFGAARDWTQTDVDTAEGRR